MLVQDRIRKGINKSPNTYKLRFIKPVAGCFPKNKKTTGIIPTITIKAMKKKRPSTKEILMSAFNLNLSPLFNSVSFIDVMPILHYW